eukprot:CAMPEP_0174710366 /NCGR_PEP_ID=MMETSP1094-20130205/12021_1 /TAXON_ID=156173 /ORGANISM="Chrysochromulina brevifilum, Strain UTEX LB 985" /LENGTH=631 /DNA_ID=CAMNT_0015909165 /DNA_START=20 /DNA_END=1915 /DNA_ORIENTATION=+
MSLAGHTSAVECVTFDSNEQTVIAGSAGGTLKLWDLEQAKVARTLTGHRSNCVSVQWHPYGEFFASGSVDTNLKIWDIRRKTCIQTYKGHTKAVRQIAFSPDGRWVVSGGDDGVVKLWDLTMGRLVHEFTQHSGPISALALHPTEFLMASASVDRTLRLWDLERFEQVCCTPPESGQVRRAVFSEDGGALLSGSEDSLKVWGWEPVRCFEQTDVRWSRLSDMCTGPGQLLAGSVREAMVAVWSVNLQAMKPFNSVDPVERMVAAPAPAPAPAHSETQHAETQRRTIVKPTSDPPPPVAAVVVPSAAPPPAAAAASSHMTAMAYKPAMAAAPETVAVVSASGAKVADEAAVQSARNAIAECRAQLAAARRSSQRSNDAPATLTCTPELPTAPASASNAQRHACTPATVETGTSSKEAMSVSGNHATIGTSMGNTLAAPSVLQPVLSSSPNSSRAPAGFEGQLQPPVANVTQQQLLAERLTAIRTLHSFWAAGDVKQMLQHLQRVSDPCVVVDLLRAGILTGGRLDLECAIVLLPTLAVALDSAHDEHALASIQAVSQLLLIFGQLICSTRAIAKDMLGVDLSAEARQQRCQAAFELFGALLPRLEQLSALGSSIRRPARELADNVRVQLEMG